MKHFFFQDFKDNKTVFKTGKINKRIERIVVHRDWFKNGIKNSIFKILLFDSNRQSQLSFGD